MESDKLKYINTLSLIGITCSLMTIAYFYKKDIEIRKENIIKRKSNNIINKENNQLKLLVDSINNFSNVSDKIVKACNDTFCIVNT